MGSLLSESMNRKFVVFFQYYTDVPKSEMTQGDRLNALKLQRKQPRSATTGTLRVEDGKFQHKRVITQVNNVDSGCAP